ncbi:TOMM precursor leader peptide-binding protein [Streptomyces thermolineatus]|uniref:TOMM precursor leader peptide-binding protein n=1 Tax=Streptomyces thermolineatus TaxID=44033 RepID=UPI00385175BA
MVKPAVRRGWRDARTLQFGVDPARAVLMEHVDRTTERLLGLLDGTRSVERVREEAGLLGLDPQRADRLLDLLAEHGVLDDTESLRDLVRGPGAPPAAALDRLRPDLASLSVVHPAPGAAGAVMAARRAAVVQVRGAGRVGAAVAALLSAAGVGTVEPVDEGRSDPWDVSPCGIAAEDVGRQRTLAARGAVRRAAPDPRAAVRARRARQAEQAGRTEQAGREGWAERAGRAGDAPGHGRPCAAGGARSSSASPALVVFAPRDGLAAWAPDPAAAAGLVESGVPHLYAGVVEGLGLVGPLVVPGGSACAGCLELRAFEEDPARPRLLAQLRSGRSSGVPACDTALATTVAGLTALHALAFLDGGVPVSVGARTRLSLAGLDTAVQRVEPHPRCPCSRARGPEGGRADRTTPTSQGRPERGAHV